MVPAEDAALLPGLRAGEETAFRALVWRHHGRLVRLAGAFTGSRARAEEAVQDAWVVVATRLDGYSGEAPLGAWITGIVLNKARSRAARDTCVVGFADMARAETAGRAVAPDRFLADGHWCGAGVRRGRAAARRTRRRPSRPPAAASNGAGLGTSEPLERRASGQ